LILGELIEMSLLQSYLIFDGNLFGILQRPIAAPFLAIALVGILWPVISRLRRPSSDSKPLALAGDDD